MSLNLVMRIVMVHMVSYAHRDSDLEAFSHNPSDGSITPWPIPHGLVLVSLVNQTWDSDLEVFNQNPSDGSITPCPIPHGLW